jgi:cysteine desulfurase
MTQRMHRVYLDWNATAPLRPEARAAMIAAMDVVGNPSSVHAEGRAARAIVERARLQVAAAFGATGADIIFTATATEAAALALAEKGIHCAGTEHDCVTAWCTADLAGDNQGRTTLVDPSHCALQAANGETGVVQSPVKGVYLADYVQAFGKIPTAFDWSGAERALLSAHKIGGPKGVAALVIRQGLEVVAQIRGGGQEMGRRSGTENVIGIAGFGAAAEAAARELDRGLWNPIELLRNKLENRLKSESPDIVIFGENAPRLPNTSGFAVPGWKGETQVMQMDLAGFAISAGSACSSGKVRASRVLQAMGHDEVTASSGIRVSMGPTTTEADVMAFADAWLASYKKHRARAA